MGTQFVFFRDPHGKAAARTDGKFAPKHLLAQLGRASIVNKNGSVGWQSFSHEFEGLFRSFVILDREKVELNDRDTRQIIWKAFSDVARRSPGKALAVAEVLRAGDRHAAAYFRQPFQKFFLVTSLSTRSLPAKRISLKGCTITPLQTRGKRYPLPEVLRSGGHKEYFAKHLQCSSYQLIRVTTRGRSTSEAVASALSNLNLLRGLWSFAATLGKTSIRLGSGPRKPIGVIHTGPVHTLHHLNGNAADERFYWFDPDYGGDLQLFKDKNQWPQIEKARKWAMARLKTVPYKLDLEELFKRYIVALDQPNPNVAFLQLWGILEKVTDTVGSHYDKTIERACWIYSKRDSPIMKETLSALRLHRNRYIHSGSSGQENEVITQLIKSFVDPHLVELLNNNFDVKSLKEYGEFLSYPTDIDKLTKMRSWVSRAITLAKKDEA